jgi:tryptophanase
MSLKKDGLVNTGGFLCVRGKYLADKCQEILIITEGFTTYGGLAGRDLNAIAAGLNEVFEEDYLRYRVRSVEYLCEELKNKGIPVMYPPGGHAVYIDAAALYPHIPVNQYPAQALVCELYIGGGIRASEIGSVMFGSYDTENNLIPATNELVRLAIPRRVYTQSHIDYVIEVFDYILENKDKVRGYEIFMQTRYLRHFTAKFKKV